MKKNIVELSKSIMNSRDARDVYKQLLHNIKTDKRFRTADGVMDVLAYVLTEGILEQGYLTDLTTKHIEQACNVKATTVRKFLSTFGFTYEKDRVTKQDDQSKSLGYIEKYYKITKIADGKVSRSKSVFTIVVTKEFYNRLHELGLEGFVELTDSELDKLHNQFKNGVVVENVVKNDADNDQKDIPDFTSDDQISESLVNEGNNEGVKEPSTESATYDPLARMRARMANIQLKGNAESLNKMIKEREEEQEWFDKCDKELERRKCVEEIRFY